MYKLLKSPSLISIFVLGGGTMVGTLISAITLIVFSRLLGPAQFGLFSAAFALMQIVIKLTDSGTSTAVERALARAYSSRTNSITSIMTVAAYLKIILYIFWVIIGWFSAEGIARHYLNIEDVSLIRLSLILSLGTVIFEYSTAVFQSAGKFTLVARITLAQALGKLFGGLLLISQSALNATTALWLYGVMPALGTIAGWMSSPTHLTFKLSKRWQADTYAILRVAKWTGIATIAATLADNLDTLMVQSMMTLYDTGVWSAAARIATFANLIPWTIGSVLSIRVTQFHEKKHVAAYLKKAKVIGLTTALLIGLIVPFSGLALYVTVGSEYLSGTTALMLMLVATALTSINAPISALYYLFDKPQYYAYAGLISTVLLIVLDYLLIPIYGINGAAVTRIIVRLGVLIFTLLFTRHVLATQSSVKK
jgi:O-antigen/teichoic acid export membrane protein